MPMKITFSKGAAGEKVVLARMVKTEEAPSPGPPHTSRTVKTASQIEVTLDALKQLDAAAEMAAVELGLRAVYSTHAECSDAIRKGRLTAAEAVSRIRSLKAAA
jgi:Flp pilus assembly protein CpaB